MERVFKVVGNTFPRHHLEKGSKVTLVRIYDDGIYEVKGSYLDHSEIKQDLHPRDLEELV